MYFYYYCRKHTTTEEIPKHVMDNYNDKGLMENGQLQLRNKGIHTLRETSIMRVMLSNLKIGY